MKRLPMAQDPTEQPLEFSRRNSWEWVGLGSLSSFQCHIL